MQLQYFRKFLQNRKGTETLIRASKTFVYRQRPIERPIAFVELVLV